MKRRGVLRAIGAGCCGAPGLRVLGAPPRRENHHSGPITSIVVGDANGAQVYSASQGGVFRDGKRLASPEWRVLALGLVVDHSRLWLGGGVPGEAGRLAVYDLKLGKIVAQREVSRELVTDLVVAGEVGSVYWGDTKGRVRSVAPGAQELETWPVDQHLSHEGPVRAVAIASTRTVLATGGLDGAVILHGLTGDGDSRDGRRLQEHTAGVESLAFSPDGKWIASGSRDARVRIHRVEDGRLIRTYKGIGMEAEPVVGRLTARVLSLAWVDRKTSGSGEPMLMAGTSNGGLYHLDETSSEWTKWAKLDAGPITSLAWRRDGHLVIGAQSPGLIVRALDG